MEPFTVSDIVRRSSARSVVSSVFSRKLTTRTDEVLRTFVS